MSGKYSPKKINCDTIRPNSAKAEINHFDNFCHMVIEEFLMKKNMADTLEQFRKEWHRPDENTSLLSWCDISLKLHLADISKGSKYTTVLENITNELSQESSIRMRKSPLITVQGLAQLPQVRATNKRFSSSAGLFTSEPVLEDDDIKIENKESMSTHGSTSRRERFIRKGKTDSTLPVARTVSNTDLAHTKDKKKQRETQLHQVEYTIKRQYDPNSIDKYTKTRVSAESCIPELVRMKALQRDLSVAMENLHGLTIAQNNKERSLKHLNIDELERAHLEESLGRKKRSQCGCCLLLFSHVNLPLSVSNKAIADLRKNWSAITGTALRDEDINEKLVQIPRCYDQIRVCRFCSQFFHDLERYRPSFEAVAIEERRKIALLREKQEKEYWDPLKMCEKDRMQADALEKEVALRRDNMTSPVH
eukprot:gene11555-24167_t